MKNWVGALMVIVALIAATLSISGLKQNAVAQGGATGSVQSAWRSALTPDELEQLGAITAARKATLEKNFAIAQAAPQASTMARFATDNEIRIKTLTTLIDQLYPEIRDGRANAMVGKFAGSNRRVFLDNVAEREVRSAINPRIVAANAKAAGAAAATQQAVAMAKTQARAASVAASARPLAPSRPFIRDPNTPLTPEEAMRGDGVMDRAEMAEEARGIGRLCSQNAYLRKYVQCGCYADAFLEQRIKRGPGVASYLLHETVTNSAEVKTACVNVAGIREMAGSGCADIARTNSRLPAARIPAFCSCVIESVTRKYSATPRVTQPYMDGLRIEATRMCKAQFGAG